MSGFELSAESSQSAQYEAVKARPLVPSSYIITHSASKKQNIGTVVRSASAFGVKEVCLVGCNQFNTSGTHGSGAHVAFKYFHNLKQCVMHLKEVEGCRVLGVEICEGAVPVQQHPFSGSTAFLLGNEGQGLSAKQMSLCDGFVYIPQHGLGAAPLNVATAAAIVLHHFAVWAEYPEREREGSKFMMAERPLRTAIRGVLQESDEFMPRQRPYRQTDSPDAPSTPSLAGSLSSKSGLAPRPAPAPAVRVWKDAAVLVAAVADYAGLCRMLLPLEMADLSNRMTSAFERATVAHCAVVIETSGGVMSAAMLPASGYGGSLTEDGATAGLRLAALHRLGRALLDAAAMVSVPTTTSSLQLQMAISLGNLMGHSPATSVPTFPTGPSSSPPAMLYFGPLLAEVLDLARRAPPMTIVAPDGEAAALRASGATTDIRGPLFLEADDGGSTAGSVGGAPSCASGGGGSMPRRQLWLVEAHPLAYQYLPPQLLHDMAGGGGHTASGDSCADNGRSRRVFAGVFNSLGLYGNKPQHISSTSLSRAASLALELESASAAPSVRASSQTNKRNTGGGGDAGSIGDGSNDGKVSSIHSSRSSSCSGTCVTFSLSARAAAAGDSAKQATPTSGSPTPGPSPGTSFLYATSPNPSHGLPSLGLELGPGGSSTAGTARLSPGVGRFSGGSSGLGSLMMLRQVGGTGTGDSDLSGTPSEPHFYALRTELAMMRQQLEALQNNAAAARNRSRSASLILPAGTGPIRRQLGASVLQHLVLMKSSVSPAGMGPPSGRCSRVMDLNTGAKTRKRELAPWEKSLRKVSKIARLFFSKISQTGSKLMERRVDERGRRLRGR